MASRTDTLLPYPTLVLSIARAVLDRSVFPLGFAHRLLDLALRFGPLVVRHPAGRLLHLAFGFLRRALQLVLVHDRLLSGVSSYVKQHGHPLRSVAPRCCTTAEIGRASCRERVCQYV